MDWFIEYVAFAFFRLSAKSSPKNCLESYWPCSQMVLQSPDKAFLNVSFLSKVIWWATLPNSVMASMAFTTKSFEWMNYLIFVIAFQS